MKLLGYFNPLIWLAIAICLVYEAFAVFNHTSGDTISAVVWRNMTTHPWIAFIFGAITGHFCLQKGTGYSEWALIGGLLFGMLFWKRGGLPW